MYVMEIHCTFCKLELASEKEIETAETPKKERWYTVRLLGSNSLKEGAMWRAA
jgi:hypothetical protein